MLKVGILTYHRSVNYGAFLQAYSLQKHVQKIFGEAAKVELIDYTSKKAHDNYIKEFRKKGGFDWAKYSQYVQFSRCVNIMQKSKESLVSDELPIIQSFLQKQNYDVIVVGSDEVWKVDGMRGFPNAYWLNFDLGETIKVSYAASSRNQIDKLKNVQKHYMNEALQQFAYIGARDNMTKRMIEELDDGFEANLNCDPTFLYSFGYDKEMYRRKFCKKYKMDESKRIIGIMIPDEQLCKAIRNKYGDDYVVVSLLDKLESADYNLLGITPFEWVKTIGILDILVTNRFHGTVFAIKNNVPFLSVDDYDDVENSKIYDLLSRCQLEVHYFPYQKTGTTKIREEILEKVDVFLTQKESADYSRIVRKEQKRAESFTKYMKNIGGIYNE